MVKFTYLQNYKRSIHMIKIRSAQADDARRIWEIRNSPEALAVAASQEVVPLAQHIDWFNNKYFQGNGNSCFVSESDNRVIGYCRFDLNTDKYTVSIAVDPSMHGKGLGTILLSQSIEQLRSSKILHAEVRKFNIASIKMFERTGFKKISEDDRNIYFEL